MIGTRTARLRFRQANDSDIDFLFALINEPSWRRFIGDPGPPTRDGAKRYLDERIEPLYRNGLGLWVTEAGDGNPIGICGLVDRDFLPAVDLGFAYLESHWRQGFGREAAQAVLRYAAGQLGLPRLQAITTAQNTASVGLLKSLDFRYLETIEKPETRTHVDIYQHEIRPATTGQA